MFFSVHLLYFTHNFLNFLFHNHEANSVSKDIRRRISLVLSARLSLPLRYQGLRSTDILHRCVDLVNLNNNVSIGPEDESNEVDGEDNNTNMNIVYSQIEALRVRCRDLEEENLALRRMNDGNNDRCRELEEALHDLRHINDDENVRFRDLEEECLALRHLNNDKNDRCQELEESLHALRELEPRDAQTKVCLPLSSCLL